MHRTLCRILRLVGDAPVSPSCNLLHFRVESRVGSLRASTASTILPQPRRVTESGLNPHANDLDVSRCCRTYEFPDSGTRRSAAPSDALACQRKDSFLPIRPLVIDDFIFRRPGEACRPTSAQNRRDFSGRLAAAYRNAAAGFQRRHARKIAARTSMRVAPARDVQDLGEDESYTLEVTPSGAKLSAPTTLGAMRGLQTFLQLIETTPQGFAVPAVVIEDKPRFPWRGLMIDSGRHFIPVEVIKRNLDAMAAVKLNVLHWHLSENQGFRVESKRFPKLQGMGSDGLFYTQDQVREIIAYARDRGIRVVPEFDMPGHSTAWFVGYPELASGPGPYSVERKWGVFDPAMDPTRESTYKFLDEFIGEMAALFPDQFFHIGGDEVNGKQWDANPQIQQFMRAHKLKNNADLQAYFNTRVQKIVAKHGKTMEGWDEILRPDLPKSIVIQSWRGQKSLADAAQQGYRGLLSFGYYLDLMNSAASHYVVDPLGVRPQICPPTELQEFWAARLACGRSTFQPKMLIRESGRARRRLPNACGLHRTLLM